MKLGGGFKYLLLSPKNWGNDPILTCAYFSDGLVQVLTGCPDGNQTSSFL